MLKTNLSTVMHRSSWVTLIGLGLMGCQQVSTQAAPQAQASTSTQKDTAQMSEKENAAVAKLEWVTTANAKEDAQKALAKTSEQSVELIAFSGRGKSFPGLTPEQFAEVESRVTYRIAQGSGDTLYGPTHKALRKELRTYVSEYNKIIYDSLTTAP